MNRLEKHNYTKYKEAILAFVGQHPGVYNEEQVLLFLNSRKQSGLTDVHASLFIDKKNGCKATEQILEWKLTGHLYNFEIAVEGWFH